MIRHANTGYYVLRKSQIVIFSDSLKRTRQGLIARYNIHYRCYRNFGGGTSDLCNICRIYLRAAQVSALIIRRSKYLPLLAVSKTLLKTETEQNIPLCCATLSTNNLIPWVVTVCFACSVILPG